MPHKKSQGRGKKIKEKEKEKKEIKNDDQYFEDIIDIDENVTKDFNFLVNAPVSEDDHFVFESEKSWDVDISKYSEYFTLDLNTLAAAIESIPFNENVDIDTKYFTNDQLTNIYNNAELGKKRYNKILSNLETPITNNPKNEESQDSVEDSAEELDFLLSLQEPVNESSNILKSLSGAYNTDSKLVSKPGTSTKPMDLEKWLDSVLDD